MNTMSGNKRKATTTDLTPSKRKKVFREKKQTLEKEKKRKCDFEIENVRKRKKIENNLKVNEEEGKSPLFKELKLNDEVESPLKENQPKENEIELKVNEVKSPFENERKQKDYDIELEVNKEETKTPLKVHHAPPVEVSLFTCGSGFGGQLGLGPAKKKIKFATPIPNTVLLCEAKAAYMQTIMLLVDKEDNTKVYTWGCNDMEAAHVLGRDGEEAEPLPVPLLEGKDIAQVSVGQYHMIALSSLGEVYFWGNYKADEFIGPNSKQNKTEAVKYPELHPDLIGKKIKQVSSAGNFTCAITENGELLEWGWCDRDTDNHSISYKSPSPLIIKGGKPQKMVCGHVHAIVFIEDEKGNHHVASWGSNRHGQLGHGDNETRDHPTNIEGLPKNVVMVACGEHHNIALTEDHKVYAWGRNSYCQLGNGDDKDVDTPQQISFFDNLPENSYIVHVSCGSNHCFAVTNTGYVYGWGFGDELQLGNGIEDLVKIPTLIKSSKIPTTHHCINTVAGTSHSIFVTVPK